MWLAISLTYHARTLNMLERIEVQVAAWFYMRHGLHLCVLFTSDWKNALFLNTSLLNFCKVTNKTSLRDRRLFISQTFLEWEEYIRSPFSFDSFVRINNYIRVRVNWLVGNGKAGQLRRTIFFQKCPFAKCILSHSVLCIQQQNKRVLRLKWSDLLILRRKIIDLGLLCD